MTALFVVSRGDDLDTHQAGLLDAARAWQELNPSGRIAVDCVTRDQSLLEANGMRSQDPVAWHAVTHLWGPGTPPDELAAAWGTWAGWQVDVHLAWPYRRSWAAGTPTPGVKQVSLVARRSELSHDEFVRRYHGHADVARVHHAGIWQYRQNTVVRALGNRDDELAIAGMSELWFASEQRWRTRFYSGPESPAAVAEDTRAFIDYRNTCSLMVTETRFDTSSTA
ncbi:MAG: EthD domain-containing protein [Acidimicrobiales bacterium]|nr:EthD domain-containing protein [Acidimicrobiales bacterium]